MSKVLYVDLDNIGKSIQDFQRLQDRIEKALDDGMNEIVDKLHSKILENLDKYGLGSSNLAGDIRVERVGQDGISIGVGADYAMYVEYGTGIVGEGNPHPNPEGWQYDINAHGEDGWQYVGDDGRLHWTLGMPSRPFMYDTWLYGRRIATKTINKHLKGVEI